MLTDPPGKIVPRAPEPASDTVSTLHAATEGRGAVRSCQERRERRRTGSGRGILADRRKQLQRGSHGQGPCTVLPSASPPLIAATALQLLDSGEILEEPNQKKDKPRRKPLPATYEPGASGFINRICIRGHAALPGAPDAEN